MTSVSATATKPPKYYSDIEVEAGDLVLLMSDGISDNFTSEEIALKKQEGNLSAEQLFFWLYQKLFQSSRWLDDIFKLSS